MDRLLECNPLSRGVQFSTMSQIGPSRAGMAGLGPGNLGKLDFKYVAFSVGRLWARWQMTGLA